MSALELGIDTEQLASQNFKLLSVRHLKTSNLFLCLIWTPLAFGLGNCDGRAITLGELAIGEKAELWTCNLARGSTPYSRFADGRAVLRSSIRDIFVRSYVWSWHSNYQSSLSN